MEATAPILFNALKHHRAWILDFIKNTPADVTAQSLRRLLLPIGAAQLDFYTGSLDISAITAEIIAYLHRAGLSTPAAYKSWLAVHNHHRLLHLSDGSAWVLRLGHEPERWAHLHPARYAPHTIRLKANTLKTAIALLIIKRPGRSEPTALLADVNAVRQLLHLPPLAARHLQKGIWETMKMLHG